MKSTTVTGLLLLATVFTLFAACNKSGRAGSETQQTLTENNAHPLVQVSGNKKVSFPGDDPGAPLYMRASTILNQFFVSEGWLVIPFYRTPSCVRPDFNLLQLFDVPAAFSCPLKVSGHYIIEQDAPVGTFPIIVQSSGSAVPFWFVRWSAFQTAAADGVVTISELQSLNPLKGTADQFKETLRPRMDHHLVQINASGRLEDGRRFQFHVTHVGDQTRSIGLKIR